MAQKPTLQVKVDGFNAALLELQRTLSGKVTKEKIINSEVGKVMEATIRRTKIATQEKIAKNLLNKSYRTYNGKKYFLGNKYPNALWSAIQDKITQSLKIKLQAIGLARRAWYEIGIKVAGKVRSDRATKKAKSPGFTPGSDTKVTKTSLGPIYYVKIENNSPLIRYSDSATALFGALAARANYFKRNLAKGVFDDMNNVLKRYPGFKTKGPT